MNSSNYSLWPVSQKENKHLFDTELERTCVHIYIYLLTSLLRHSQASVQGQQLHKNKMLPVCILYVGLKSVILKTHPDFKT